MARKRDPMFTAIECPICGKPFETAEQVNHHLFTESCLTRREHQTANKQRRHDQESQDASVPHESDDPLSRAEEAG